MTPFQLESYTTAAAEGRAPAMLAAAILVAPAGEEVMFRGFLFRGWARSDRVTWPAIVVISGAPGRAARPVRLDRRLCRYS